ncbi:MAG: hypothetical protein DIZ80_11820 [endosymbiont of Galathealinum brachiosum]|uniref:Lipoprotein n=1 Tax=endosymbiont of Galathealinum brachiosum TaxID=2200906 RepID=A0A370DFL7_9GAMM|nr:MAG: hypothetical protein DIZ80_11820 [endosymbiont of Galathealinum brachiosum]
MKAFLLTITSIALTSCISMHSNDPASLLFNIPDGSSLTLNKDLPIAKDNTHVVIQHGKIVAEKNKNQYDISCSFEMKAFGPRTVTPDTFIIRRTEDGEERVTMGTVRYNTEVYLHSDHNSDIIKLDCSVWGNRADGSFSVSEMQAALGDYFSFNFTKTIK